MMNIPNISGTLIFTTALKGSSRLYVWIRLSSLFSIIPHHIKKYILSIYIIISFYCAFFKLFSVLFTIKAACADISTSGYLFIHDLYCILYIFLLFMRNVRFKDTCPGRKNYKSAATSSANLPGCSLINICVAFSNLTALLNVGTFFAYHSARAGENSEPGSA